MVRLLQFISFSFLLFFCFFSSALASPLDALTSIQQGIDNNDIDKVEKGMDIDSVVTSSLDIVLKHFMTQADNGQLQKSASPAITSLLLITDDPNSFQAIAIKALALQELKTLLRSSVRGGYLAGKPDPSTAGNMGKFSFLLKNLDKSRKEIIPGKVISLSKNDASVTATFVDKKNHIPLILTMKKSNDIWRVKEIANLQEIITKATKK